MIETSHPGSDAAVEELPGWVRGLQRRVLDEREVAERWRAARQEEVERAASALCELAGVRRVVLFGSLARGEASPGSDVDLWVEGLEAERWLDAIAVARAAISGAEVDLVRAEAASPALRARVALEGMVLRER